MIKLLTVLCLLSSFAQFKVNAQDNTPLIAPFIAKYELFRQGKSYGKGQRQLKQLENGHFQLELRSELEWLIFDDKRQEISEFTFSGNQITPIRYQFNRSGTGADKALTVNFNRDGTIKYKPSGEDDSPTQWQAGWLDEMSLHMQIQADLKAGKDKFSYQIISSGAALREYNLEVIGHELISTGMGRFEAVKVARIYDKPTHTALHAWFIPELDFTLARLWRIKKGVEQYNLVINDYQPTTEAEVNK